MIDFRYKKCMSFGRQTNLAVAKAPKLQVRLCGGKTRRSKASL